jgi:proton-translocating NADH-quinone oxidoreductase chain N
MTIPLVLQPIAVLLFASALVPFVDYIGKAVKFVKLRDLFAVAAFAAATWTVFNLYVEIEGVKPHVMKYSLENFGPPLGVMFVVDPLSIFMALLFCGMGLTVAVYSLKYMEHDTGLEKYYSLLLALVAGMVGVVFAGDFFNLFVFWEAMCIASYALVAFRKHRWEPVEAGFKYLVMSTFGSILVLYAMSFIYGLTGTLNFAYMAERLSSTAMSPMVPYFLIGAIIVGFGVTASMVPFHEWLPDAHPAAPSGISAMLSGVVIKAGVYAMLRALFTIFSPVSFDYGTALTLFAILTMTVANFMALMQRDIKRLLAYSSIVNIGYILVGIGIGAYVLSRYHAAAPALALSVAVFAIMGALFHLLNHAIGKGLLFLCSGCFAYRAGTRDLMELEGIGKKMLWTGSSFSIGLLALAGVPPLNGFWSKLFIILAGFSLPEDNFMKAIAIIVVLNSVFSASYYLWLVQRVMLKEPKLRVEGAVEAPVAMVLPIVILAAACVIIGAWPGVIIRLAEEVAYTLLGGW